MILTDVAGTFTATGSTFSQPPPVKGTVWAARDVGVSAEARTGDICGTTALGSSTPAAIGANAGSTFAAANSAESWSDAARRPLSR